MINKKISLYRDGAIGFDNQLFESLTSADMHLRLYAANTPQPRLCLAFERPHNFESTGQLIYFVHRLGFEEIDTDDDAMVDPRPVGAAHRLKRLTFWGANQDDDSLVRDVIAGRKTVTADTVAAYYQPDGEFGDGSYEPGELIEVYDLKQRLRCLIRATKVYHIRFGDIPEEVWRGEAFDSADQFRQVHIDCMPHLDLHDDFEFVTLHFALEKVCQ